MTLNNNTPLRVGEIRLIDGTVIQDRDVFVFDGFIIVSGEQEQDSPIWYSTAFVASMHEVIAQKATKPQRMRIC